jgi:hypothetical protein
MNEMNREFNEFKTWEKLMVVVCGFLMTVGLFVVIIFTYHKIYSAINWFDKTEQRIERLELAFISYKIGTK